MLSLPAGGNRDSTPTRLPATLRPMGIFNAIFGTASQIDPAELSAELGPLLIDGEEIVGAFKIVRDLVVFTQVRLILADK